MAYSKTYSNLSNCRRAARKAGLDADDIQTKSVDGGFAFRLPQEAGSAERATGKSKTPDVAADKPKRKGKPDVALQAAVADVMAGRPTDYGLRAAEATPAPKSGSKADQALAAMRAEGGVTGAELQAMLGWASHTVRGFISGTVRKKMGLDVQTVREGQTTRYSLPAA